MTSSCNKRSDYIKLQYKTLIIRVAALLICGAAFLFYQPKPAEQKISAKAICYEAQEPVQQPDPEDSISYAKLMMEACQLGDFKTGRKIEQLRNAKIDRKGLRVEKVDFEDLTLLAGLIHNEAGSNWLSMDWKIKVGEVLMNRVSSPEFPNTIADCINAPGQYDIRTYGELPSRESVEAAFFLLSGHRLINHPAVVFQANFKQGSGVYEVLHDDVLGDTYLCYSNHPELYE